MAIAVEGFKVVTEFVFNADRALNVAESLNKQVDKLSSAADNAVNSVARMGISYAMTFSGASGGILGILGNAIKSSDKFRSTQIELANTMVSNQMTIAGSVITFNEALIQSDLIMGKIVKKSRDFGLSPDAFTSQVKFFNNMLAPKGLAGTNLSESIEIARVSMKAAPALGVSNEQAISGILSGISGQLSRNTQFGTRLFMESGKSIEDATGIKNLKEFNKAKPEKRIRALIVGLDKLAGSADAVNARADTLGSRLMQMRDVFTGVGSILKPLGDVVMPLIKESLDMAIGFLKNEGAEIVKQMAIFIKGFMKGPKEMLLDLLQIKRLSSDFGTAIGIGSMALMIAHASELITFLNGFAMTKGLAGFVTGIGALVTKIPLIGPMLSGVVSSFTKMFSLNLSGGLMSSVMSIGGVMLRMAGFVGILLIPLQGLSRAIERIKMENLLDLGSLLPKVGEWMNTLKSSFMLLVSPITDMIDGWSELFYSLIRMLPFMGRGNGGLIWIIDSLVDVVRTLSIVFGALWGTIKGIIGGISAVMGSMAGGKFTGLGEDFKEAFTGEFAKTMDKIRTPTLGPDGSAGKTVTNYVNQDIKMNNSFKEVLQPDRIAFTIKEQLEKASRNKTGGGGTILNAGSSLSSRANAGI